MTPKVKLLLAAIVTTAWFALAATAVALTVTGGGIH